jgi:hypothetical protein
VMWSSYGMVGLKIDKKSHRSCKRLKILLAIWNCSISSSSGGKLMKEHTCVPSKRQLIDVDVSGLIIFLLFKLIVFRTIVSSVFE